MLSNKMLVPELFPCRILEVERLATEVDEAAAVLKFQATVALEEAKLLAIEMAGVKTGFTVFEIALLVAVVGAEHAAFEVSTTVTELLLANVFDVNVELLVPVLFPFTFH